MLFSESHLSMTRQADRGVTLALGFTLRFGCRRQLRQHRTSAQDKLDDMATPVSHPLPKTSGDETRKMDTHLPSFAWLQVLVELTETE